MLTPDRNIIPRDALNKKAADKFSKGDSASDRYYYVARSGTAQTRRRMLLAGECDTEPRREAGTTRNGDNYQHEAKRLREQAPSDRDAVGQSRRPQQPISASFART